MKKYLAMVLCPILLCVLFAGCGSKAPTAQSNASDSFRVGYGSRIISPKDPVPLSGYGDEMERISTVVPHELYVTCTAFADTDGETLVLLAMDLSNCTVDVFPTVRQNIADALGLPVDHVLISTSHNHSGPATQAEAHPNIPPYIEFLTQQAIDAGKEAMETLSPATMETTFSRPEKINCVRHYLLNDGTMLGEGVGNINKARLIGHTTRVDNLLQVVKFKRETGKDVIMINWAGHPRNNDPYPYTAATSNYPGVLRAEVEKALDCHTMFILSGSGNVNNWSQIPGELTHETYVELGTQLAQEVVKAAENFQPATLEKLQVTENIQTITNKGGTPVDCPLYAFSMGDFACVTAPFEIFDTNAMAVRDASKFQMTFYSSCSNLSLGYLPTPYAFDFNAYEARITKFPMGTAEYVQDQMTQMLDKLFADSGYTAKEKAPGYQTPPNDPWTDDVLYMNPTPGSTSTCKEVENGYWQMTLVNGSTAKLFLVLNEEVLQEVIAKEYTKVLFDQSNVIVGVTE